MATESLYNFRRSTIFKERVFVPTNTQNKTGNWITQETHREVYVAKAVKNGESLRLSNTKKATDKALEEFRKVYENPDNSSHFIAFYSNPLTLIPRNK